MAKGKVVTAPSVPIKRKKVDDSGRSRSRLFYAVTAIFLPGLLGFVGYNLHHSYIVLPSIVVTKSPLPVLLSNDHFSPKKNSYMYWGSYRPQLYFGMRARSPDSPLAGLMWFSTFQTPNTHEPKIRHWCDISDGLDHYTWTRHDGRNFGQQMIREKDGFVINTDFVKAPGGDHGGDWTARIVAHTESAESDTEFEDGRIKVVRSLIFYIALPDEAKSSGAFLKSTIEDDQRLGSIITKISGFTSTTGHFSVKFRHSGSLLMRSYTKWKSAAGLEITQLPNILMSKMGIIQLDTAKTKLRYLLGLMEKTASDQPNIDEPNFLAIQITFYRDAELEIVYETANNPRRVKTLSEANFESELEKHAEAFDRKFEEAFQLREKGLTDQYTNAAQAALSNMLGGIGYWHGWNRVQSQYNSKPVKYGPHQLFSTVPSRPYFPRGFLWDEGFHQLLISRFDSELTREILSSWFDLMNEEGWIPREQILGTEAEAKVPDEFIVQRDNVANPPMLLYVISRLLMNEQFVKDNNEFFVRIYPRAKVWYNWLRNSQSGLIPNTYRWRGRNSSAIFELNPKTLASGLDDYPRASHPTDDEYHLDLHCWILLGTKVIIRLAQNAKDAGLQEAANDEKQLSTYLDDIVSSLDQYHWSEKTGRYADYGLHTRNVKLERQSPPRDQQGRPLVNPDSMPMVRVTIQDPSKRLITDTFGYVSLFPLILRQISPESGKLKRMLDQLKDPELLWTPYGLRSLAKNSPLFNKHNTEHDPPYWRGNIWINMNYLIVGALRHYSEESQAYGALAFSIYSELRNALVNNIIREYRKTGYIWENYNEQDGHGQGAHPFTGWSSLFVSMMAEVYD